MKKKMMYMVYIDDLPLLRFGLYGNETHIPLYHTKEEAQLYIERFCYNTKRGKVKSIKVEDTE
jgi:hypothetical protein